MAKDRAAAMYESQCRLVEIREKRTEGSKREKGRVVQMWRDNSAVQFNLAEYESSLTYPCEKLRISCAGTHRAPLEGLPSPSDG